jgi:hypothetical protein
MRRVGIALRRGSDGVDDLSGGPRFRAGHDSAERLLVFMSALRRISAALDTGDINTALKRCVRMYILKGSNPPYQTNDIFSITITIIYTPPPR